MVCHPFATKLLSEPLPIYRTLTKKTSVATILFKPPYGALYRHNDNIVLHRNIHSVGGHTGSNITSQIARVVRPNVWPTAPRRAQCWSHETLLSGIALVFRDTFFIFVIQANLYNFDCCMRIINCDSTRYPLFTLRLGYISLKVINNNKVKAQSYACLRIHPHMYIYKTSIYLYV